MSILWTDQNYPNICGSRTGICPSCKQECHLSSVLIDKNNNVELEYCQSCGVQTTPRRERQ